MRLVRRVTTAWRFLMRPRIFDTTMVVVLVGVACAGMISVLLQGHRDVAAGAALFIVTSLPLLVRRSRPVPVTAIVVTLDILGTGFGVITANSLPGAIALYSVGRYTPGRTAALTAGPAALAYGAASQLATPGPGALVPAVVYVLVFVGVGQLVRARAELGERERREAADNAVRAERRRIARELHDVVAHHLSVINALVGGARATLPPGHEVTREALAGAEGTARQALAEMRQLLDVLRADGGDGADAATGVGAARLSALVKEAMTAGLPASLTVTGEVTPLPTAVDHAVYRIVQEALTNTRKHASGARASVLLTYRAKAVEVEVVDDGSAEPDGVPGFGLSGMAERVALCGGELHTGPRPEGGFRVHARIPLEQS
ncbi:histidine kinase [Nonomuraea sp. NPDC048916]|uniref:sensor histidine kinase n=1 Tax=Nonomuraea sp. NPDC048916 TaxID=3154232 RepID=UPI0033E133B3